MLCRPPGHLAGLAGVVLMALLAGGCASYELRGKVIEGHSPGARVVEADDPRLDEPGVGGAAVDVTLDPGRLQAKRIGSGMSDDDGTFALEIDEFGAGFLEHRVEVRGEARGRRVGRGEMILPGSGKRVLVVVPTTAGGGEDDEPDQPGDFLEETMRSAEPYLD